MDNVPLRASRKLKSLSVELGLGPHSHRCLNNTKLKVCYNVYQNDNFIDVPEAQSRSFIDVVSLGESKARDYDRIKLRAATSK